MSQVVSKDNVKRRDQLRQLHNDLFATLVRFQQNLPSEAEDITEGVERHARVIALMIKTMNTILEREENFQAEATEAKSREDIIKELEHIFSSILAENETPKISEPTDG